MPQGKGTYGSKVGRPPKKYQEGGTTGQTEAVMDAAQKGQELKSISLENIPTENAPDRSENYQLGGQIKPPTAPSISQYEKGGKVDPKDVSRRVGSSLSKGAKKGYKRPTYTPYEGSKTPIQDMRDFNKMQDIKERRMKDKKK